MAKFEELPLDSDILESLREMGYEQPTPIQEKMLPLILEGRDLIGLAKTGSGKTAACAIPICHKVDVSRSVIQALVIIPTRELALQYATEAQKIGKRKGIKAFTVVGGELETIQKAKLKDGVHVLVATPGRLIDLIYSRSIDLSNVETLILDEADEMLSMGFYDDLEFIIKCLNHKHQTLLFSATMPPKIKRIAEQHMSDPVEVNVITQTERIPSSIKQYFIYCSHKERIPKLIEQMKVMGPKQSMIFCESRKQVEEVCNSLKREFSSVDFLHAGLSQDIRNIVTGKFRSGKIHHLVATDIAARGLDFTGVTHVFLFELPKDPDTYVHRAGRTGRSGREGAVISFVTGREMDRYKAIEKKAQGAEGTSEWIGGEPTAEAAGVAPKRKPRSYPRSKPS
jgi:ATP-dependent RNA helicase DeaD